MIRATLLFILLATTTTVFAASVEQHAETVPILINKPPTPLLEIAVDDISRVRSVYLDLTGTSTISAIDAISLAPGKLKHYPGETKTLASVRPSGPNVALPCDIDVKKSGNDFTVFVQMKPDADLTDLIRARLVGVEDAEGTLVRPAGPAKPVIQRLGVCVMDGDEVKGARIPGIATTPKGTLLAIYDARYETGRDLQGHIDIGLSRSTDGGQTWEPMKPIIDMGTWGGLPEKYNGVSDPCVLVDQNTGKIFVAGLWMHGVKNEKGKWVGAQGWNHQWKEGGSGPGFDPKETSQFMMVESTDDGVTWSQPRNMTKLLKNRDWRLFAPAPGRGITLKDGTLVMPTEGINENAAHFSNFIYSTDHGKTWNVAASGTPKGVTSNENQIVQLSDGSLMMNMRSSYSANRDADQIGRAVSVTHDMGRTWTEHPTSGRALPEPGCCAGLLAHGDLLVFSNPPNPKRAGNRTRMTLKFSLDDGTTWPEKYHLLLDSGKSAYSCLTSVDDETIGILYEGSRARICFQKVKISTLPLVREKRAR